MSKDKYHWALFLLAKVEIVDKSNYLEDIHSPFSDGYKEKRCADVKCLHVSVSIPENTIESVSSYLPTSF